jgi:hypothetical protein
MSFKSKFADRGKDAEKLAEVALKLWAGDLGAREFNRLIDTRAAGRTVKAAAADFEFFAAGPVHGLIEVKETEHAYRLERSKVPQLPKLHRRVLSGGVCVVLVYHSTTNVWRAVTAEYLMAGGDKGSWNLTDQPTFADASQALLSINPTLFTPAPEKPPAKTLRCSYCGVTKPSAGFKVVSFLRSTSKKYKCVACQEVRQDPKVMADRRQEEEEAKAARNALKREAASAAMNNKRKGSA